MGGRTSHLESEEKTRDGVLWHTCMFLNEAIIERNLLVRISTEKGLTFTRTDAADHSPIGKTRRDSVIGRGVMGSQAGQKQAAGRENTTLLEIQSVLTHGHAKLQ